MARGSDSWIPGLALLARNDVNTANHPIFATSDY
jgi:hypothetical protein